MSVFFIVDVFTCVYTGCYKITTVFSHAQTVVLCVGCSTVLCQPTGGKARLTEGMSFGYLPMVIDIQGSSFFTNIMGYNPPVLQFERMISPKKKFQRVFDSFWPLFGFLGVL